KKIASFGVAHFTWDWFFSKLYPSPLSNQVMNRMVKFANHANVIYFPPFTPQEILNHYKKKGKQVPLIVRKINSVADNINTKKFNILFMDSGAGILGRYIIKALKQINTLRDFHFFASSDKDKLQYDNVTLIDKEKLFIDYIPRMNLVIGRAGFNTISECIAYRVPMLLISEAMNPEMNENIVNIKKAGLGSFISLEDFSSQLNIFLPKFIDSEYKIILEKMKNHEYKTDGARVVAEDILNRIS
ncbi:MAG: glycosyltransferase, partial [Bacteroidota bacterium]